LCTKNKPVARELKGLVTNGCTDNMSGTSEVPQLTDPLCATRKSAEVGQKLTKQCNKIQAARRVAILSFSALISGDAK
jgi:hypothetical protein